MLYKTDKQVHWLYRNFIQHDDCVRFYGKFSTNFDALKIDFCLGKLQPDPQTIPPIELIIPKIQKGPLYDNITIPPNFGILVSEKLKGVFDSANVCNIQWYRTIIKGNKNILVSNKYYLGNIVGCVDGVDFEKSELILDDDDGSIDFIDKLILKDDLSLSLLPIFRINEYIPLKVVSNDLMKLISSSGCTGINFLEPEKLKL